MNSVIVSAHALDIVNDLINDIIGYSSDSKNNFTTELSEYKDNEGNEIFKVHLSHNDSNKIVFEGIFYHKDLIKVLKIEDEKAEMKENNKK